MGSYTSSDFSRSTRIKATLTTSHLIMKINGFYPPAALKATGREWQGDFKCAMISAAFNLPPDPPLLTVPE